jgi:hypothetical protein
MNRALKNLSCGWSASLAGWIAMTGWSRLPVQWRPSRRRCGWR